ncbi:MAG: Gmad2 immunoglobulin-like domain-containing protein [Patescibacteria group bacterium]
MGKSFLIVFGVLIVLAGGLYAASLYAPTPTNPQEVQPRFTYLTSAETDDVVLDTPLLHATVNSPFIVSGEARGSWFFEASFPIYLLDAHGNMLGQGIAQAQSDWMTSDYVPFTATITFTADAQIVGDAGTLVLQKDNPSGLPENEDSLRVPVVIGE